jgi:hypothetical protein
MDLVKKASRISFVLLLIGLAGGAGAQTLDSLKNLPEYSLPISHQKLIIAHCMTNIMRFKGHPFEDGCNPNYYLPTGNITASIGGMTQVLPMEDTLLSGACLDSAVAFEMRAAMASGIDGFQFYYPMHTYDWDNIIIAYFRMAKALHLNFYFTFCVSHPGGGTQASRVGHFASRINRIMDSVGHQNPHWLRTPDGRLIVYLWQGAGLADIPKDASNLPPAYYIANAFKQLADQVHEHFACMYDINEQISPEKLNAFLDYFPACWIWTLPYRDQYIGQMIASTCASRHRTFMGSTFCDFYTSKVLLKGTWNIQSAVQVEHARLDQLDRKYISTGLSYNFRKLLEFGISQNAPIINIITWNDYPEGHHLAPEINHNEGFSILLQYYKSLWKGQPSPYQDRDIAIAFFKKYSWTQTPDPFNFSTVPVEKGTGPGWEDSIEVVTILRAPGTLSVNGQSKPVGAGFQSTRFASQPGVVNVSVGQVHFTTPAQITTHPIRTDRLTYSYSSEHDAFYQPLWGSKSLWPAPIN